MEASCEREEKIVLMYVRWKVKILTLTYSYDECVNVKRYEIKFIHKLSPKMFMLSRSTENIYN